MARRLAPPLNAIVREDVEEGSVGLLELPSFLTVDFDASITRGGSESDISSSSSFSSSLVNTGASDVECCVSHVVPCF